MQQQSKYENTAYLALWGLLFAVPLMSLYVRSASNSELTFNWQEVFVVWRQFAVYLLLFLIHNFLLAPLLVYRNKRWLYGLLTLCMIGAFTLYQCNSRPEPMRGPRHRPMEQRGPEQRGPEQRGPELREPRPEHADRGFGHQPPPEFRGKRPDRKPPVFVGEHDIVAIVVLILMCGMNLGIKFYFRTRNDHKRLLALEKENLEQQLEYLRYQITPPFYTNPLNNIHALVDIDPEKAKDTILELSKMMRFVLYEGDKKGVPLAREIEFISHYITLMKLRYTDKVKISVELPKELGDNQIPPLILVTFIENAFKHGISYQHESFINIQVAVNDKLTFICRNSKAEKPNEEKGGVGLKNVKKRLDLLYDSNYTLDIQDGDNVYSVELTIPLSPITQHPSPNTHHPTPITQHPTPNT